MNRKRVGAIGAIGASLAMLGGGIAWASIPDTSGQINSCYRKSTGDLRVVDSGGCRSDESALSWAQTGPQGPVGPQGAQGPPGGPVAGSLVGIRTVTLTGVIPAGSGATAPTYHQFDCPSGYVLIGYAGHTQNDSEQAKDLPALTFTPSGDAASDSEAATSVVVDWINTSSSDLGYQAFLNCSQRS